MTPEECYERQLCFVCLRFGADRYMSLGPGIIYHESCKHIVQRSGSHVTRAGTYGNLMDIPTEEERLAFIEAQQIPDGLR